MKIEAKGELINLKIKTYVKGKLIYTYFLNLPDSVVFLDQILHRFIRCKQIFLAQIHNFYKLRHF